jgi:GntR family transcriptional regulator
MDAAQSRLPLRKALYLQVRDALTERIASGTWKPGTTIANESDLARDLGVSSGTVRKALELMEAQRLIRRRQGRGTFVNDQNSTELAARFCNFRGADGQRVYGRLVTLEVDEGVARDEECRRLRLGTGAAVYRIRRVQRLADKNFMIEDATVPAARFPHLAAKRDAAASICALAQQYGALLGQVEERVSLGEPTVAGVMALGIAPGTPVMLRDRLVLILNGTPIEWGVTQWHLPGGHYRAGVD